MMAYLLTVFTVVSMSHAAPELIRSSYEPGDVKALCDAAVAQARAQLDAIAAVPEEERTVENTLLAFEGVLAPFYDQAYSLEFMGYVSTNEAISAEGSACESTEKQFTVEVYTRPELYRALKATQNQISPENRALTRLASETLKRFEQNGMQLDPESLEKFRSVKQEIAQLETEFSEAINKDQTFVIYTEAELEGVSADFLASQERIEDETGVHYKIKMKTPKYVHIMENAQRAETRKRAQMAYYDRGGVENIERLEKAVSLRDQAAHIMGFNNWAEYQTNFKLAGSDEAVLEFLNGLKNKLRLRAEQDFAKFREIQQEMEPESAEIRSWDYPFYATEYVKRNFQVDPEVIKEYFPVEKVTQGVFSVYSNLFGVDFVQVEGAPAWEQSVTLYEIRDRASGNLAAHFYLDPFPRAGKYGHFAAFQLISGRVLADGSYQLPVSAIVANFPEPSPGKPSLLTHDDVETFFHEFGHIMHQTLTKAPYSSLAGSSVAGDFVEAPSQMLEEWVWNPEILGLFASHYETGAGIPPELFDRMLAARRANDGLSYTRQLFLGLFDMTIHTSGAEVDVMAVHDSLYQDVMTIKPPVGSHYPAAFGHMMGGYDAGYYGYLWSKVYAVDMFTRFEAEGLLSPEAGAAYRRTILEGGGMRDPRDLMREFLNRELSSEAFFRYLGITSSP